MHPVDVLVLSPEVKEPDALGLAEFVGRQAPGTAIVLVRDHTWNGLLPAAMRAGIRDVVDMTQGTEELRDAVERAIVWASNLRSVGVSMSTGHQSQRGRIISVFSSKGGAGKTFLTTNLAAAIAETHRAGHRCRRPRLRHGRRLHLLRDRARHQHPRADGAGRGRERTTGSARSA